MCPSYSQFCINKTVQKQRKQPGIKKKKKKKKFIRERRETWFQTVRGPRNPRIEEKQLSHESTRPMIGVSGDRTS